MFLHRTEWSRRARGAAIAALVASLASFPARGSARQGAGGPADTGWPRTIETQGWVVTVYQPQTDKLDGDRLEGRAAVSVQRAGSKEEPVFGAVWFDARLAVDRQNRMARVRSITIPTVRFADATDPQRKQLSDLLVAEIPKWDLSIDLDRLVASLDLGAEAATTAGLKHDPPRFIHSTEPAVLVVFDGKPVIRDLESGVGLEYVVNTPFPVVRQENGATFYLFGGGTLWYSAADPLGPWAVTSSVPAPVRRVADTIETAKASSAPTEAKPPKIITASEPTELLVSRGEPTWSPIGGTGLLYCDNTDSDVFLEAASERYFVLAGGRWYAGRAASGDVTWTHVPNDRLPSAFAEIPADSPKGHVLVHVAGTPQARQEVVDNAIPDIRAVRRDASAVGARYDGAPQFVPVDGAAGVAYAVNTAAAVFRTGTTYYLCDNAVWYRSDSPAGTWQVAAEVPASIYSIPPSNPHYNATYVRVYDTTPDAVYVGYTPGYLGSFVADGSVVWGTGWSYTPTTAAYYYPFPWTWGLHMGYQPWSGWGVGVGWTSGPFQITIGWIAAPYQPYSYGGWYGPGGYLPPYPRGPVYVNPAPGMPAMQPQPRPGIYDRPTVSNRLATPTSMGTYGLRPSTGGTANNVFTDRGGKVYRQNASGGWEERQGGTWNAATGLDRGAGGAATRPQLERDAQARTTGSAKSSQFRGGGR